MTENDKKITKSQSAFLPVSLGMLCFFGTIYGIYRFFSFIFDNLKQFNPNVTVALITVCGTVIVSLISVLVAKHYEHKAEIRREQHSKKVEIYENFIGVWFDVLFAEKLDKNQLSEKEMFAKLAPIIRQLIPWGSDDVIKSFVKFRDSASQSEDNPSAGLCLFDNFEKVLLNIRKDLGHPNKGLKRGDITRIFINNYNEYSQKCKEQDLSNK